MAPKAKRGKSSSKDKPKMSKKDALDAQANAQANAGQNRVAKIEADARELAESIERGPGPPPFWILDSAAKLRDSQCRPHLREGAARKLQERMEEAAPFVTYFAGAVSCAIVGDDIEEVRLASVEALGALGESGVPYTDALTHSVLKDRCASVRGAAAKALGRCCGNPQKTGAKEMCASIFGLPNQDEAIQQLPAEILTEIAEGFGENLTRKDLPLIKDLMELQRDDVKKETKLRKEAARKLCRAALLDVDGEIIKLAVEAFSKWLVEGLPALALFCTTFVHQSSRAKSQKSIDALLPVAMDDVDEGVRQKATEALSDLGTSTEPMFAQLAATLQNDPNTVTRLRAAMTFGSFIKVSDQMAAEALTAQGSALASIAMRDKVPGIRQSAAEALGLAPEEAASPYIGELVTSLETGTDDDRVGAARALGALGQAALPHILDLFTAVLQDSDFSVRYWSSESLGIMGEPAVPYIRVFAAVALYDVDQTYRNRSNDALQNVGKLAAEVVAQFSVECEDDEQERQEAAAKALEVIEVPFSGLIIVEKVDPKARRNHKRNQRPAVVVDTPIVPKVNTDFCCNVGQFFKEVVVKKAEEQALKDAENASNGMAADGLASPQPVGAATPVPRKSAGASIPEPPTKTPTLGADTKS